ncbi:MAG: HlyD family efflux transporter periplasmic adaptor subunit [Bacteroidia bacterium]|nr:HlyD family efflux transporter periplasmic adaptor subunit [Bacteroidia bacterium]
MSRNMLNISPQNPVDEKILNNRYQCFTEITEPRAAHLLSRWLMGLAATAIGILFLPWTQNIEAKGKLTTLKPSQRPQTIHSTLAGRIERWYVNEGDTVRQGDTIAFLSEIKDDYFDPQLLARTEAQIDAKSSSVTAYDQKAEALDAQIEALLASMDLKTAQARNKITQANLKIQSDSIDLEAVRIQYNIANIQFARWDTLYKQGIKSRTEWEEKRNKLQESVAKLVSQENKLGVSRNELLNARLELTNVRNEYGEKISKAQSDRQGAFSDRFQSVAEVAKMQNQRTNYEARTRFRYITAPQDGFINKTLKPGIGETVKEGEAIVSILPLYYDLAVELYIRPVDLPLVRRGEKVRLAFDGWPAIVFSGWPNTSFGTFGGLIYAVENNISDNGLYRILIQPDPADEPWPNLLRIGSGANGFALLNDVPLWYEVWRQLNGFPPNYYDPESITKPEKLPKIKTK